MAVSPYVVCTLKPWNIAAFHRRTPALPGGWHLIDRPELFSADALAELAPRYIFFPHWSWKVSPNVLSKYECVCFHMTDVPYGRGGSPLQNLILRGHKSTVVSALRMIEELDAGPVYAKLPLSLDGSAEEIYGRAADLVYDLISEIVLRNPTPVAQAGEPTVFARRTPEQSLLPSEGTPPQAYDFIRMLDASTYPRAYLQHGSLRMEFSQAHLISDEEVVARVVIRRADQ